MGIFLDTTSLGYEILQDCDVDGSRGMRNLIHCTDPADGEGAYDREVNLWFTQEEIHNYKLVSEAMLYDVNLDGILE